MTNVEIYNSIAYLKNCNTLRKNKYRRNLRKYLSSPTIDLDSNNFAVGWSYLYADDTLPPSNLNVIKSIIDTLTSKIAQSKVRPYFNTTNGDYNDMQSAIQAQQYFDIVFENYNVHKIVSEAFRDSCIFDTGVIFVDTDDVKRANPWGVYFDPNETNNNVPYSRIVYERTNFPVTALPTKVREKIKNKSIVYCSYSLYFDVTNKIKAYLVNDKIILTEAYNTDIVPFVFLPYQRLIGNTSLSVVDTLYTLQTEIDILEQKISEASQLTPANTMFVPENSNIKANQINNGIGNIMTYRPAPGGSSNPVTISTPSFIAQQYIDTRNDYIQKAYELSGISLLSATGQKPSGVDSGIALSTLENVESDRFETQVKQVINSYVEITKLIIKLKENDENILPEANNIYNVKWADIKNSIDNMKIQFSAADSLSKDPSVKLQQLQVLAQQGIIPKNRVAQLMELPDIQSGYNLSNNAINAVYTVIDDCINHDVFTVPSYIPFVMLKEEIINTQLSLKASNKQKNIEDIKKLQRLYEIVEKLEEQYVAADPNQQVLEQEATTKAIEPGSMRTEDLDATTDNNENGSWGAQYNLKSQPE